MTILTNHGRENETQVTYKLSNPLCRGKTNFGHGISTMDRMCTNTIVACPVIDLLEFRAACLKYCQHSLPRSAVLLNTEQRHQHAMKGV